MAVFGDFPASFDLQARPPGSAAAHVAGADSSHGRRQLRGAGPFWQYWGVEFLLL